MDIFLIFSYLNKISLLAFIITAFFLGYQFYFLKKELSVNDDKTPVVPNFNENEKIDLLNYTKLPDSLISEHQTVIKNDTRLYIILVVSTGLVVLILGILINIKIKRSEQISKITEKPILTTKPIALISKQPTEKSSETMIPTATKSIEVSPTPTKEILPSIQSTLSPTEVIIAMVSPTVEPSISIVSEKISPTATVSNLPITGIIDQSLIFFGAAISFIFFAFLF